jgi:hypothetical protein
MNTHFMINDFSPKTVTFMTYVEKYGTARQATNHNLIRRMRIACLTTEATDTLRICNTYCFSTATVVIRVRLNAAFYVQWLSFVKSNDVSYQSVQHTWRNQRGDGVGTALWSGACRQAAPRHSIPDCACASPVQTHGN